MKLKCPTLEEQLEEVKRPHTVFVWRKVRVMDGGCRWLERVVRYYPYARLEGNEGYEYPQKDRRYIHKGPPTYYSIEGFLEENPEYIVKW